MEFRLATHGCEESLLTIGNVHELHGRAPQIFGEGLCRSKRNQQIPKTGSVDSQPDGAGVRRYVNLSGLYRLSMAFGFGLENRPGRCEVSTHR
jgi:hypothetical protein